MLYEVITYDSKKSGGFTASHLRFGDKKIQSPYLVTTPDFVACHVPAYLGKYDMLKGLKKGGTFLLNSIWDENEVKNYLPDDVKKYLAANEISMYIINATKIAEEIGLGNRTNTIMQAAFFKIAEVIPRITSYNVCYTKLLRGLSTLLSPVMAMVICFLLLIV